MLSLSESFIKRRIAAELLAYTVWKIFPNVTLAGGGVHSLGFFYDFIFEQPLLEDSLALIEVGLRTLLKEDLPLRFASMMRENAQAYFSHHQHPLLAEKAGEEELNIIEVLQLEKFSGLCPSLEVQSTGEIGYIKLLDVQSEQIELGEESYLVTRLLGNAFLNPYDLKKFSKEYAIYKKKGNHQLLGKELNLFSQSEQLGQLEWIWHPKGEQLRTLLKNWIEPRLSELAAAFVSSPLIIKEARRKNKTSPLTFHLGEEHYQFASSPLLSHSYLLNAQWRAQEVLPLKVIEYFKEYKFPSDAEVCGLLCGYSYLKDQMTICCQEQHTIKQLISSLLFIEQIIRIFSFEAHWYLITSPKKSGKGKIEKAAIEKLVQAAQGAFYPLQSETLEEEEIEGPRLELRIVDRLGRQWPCSTLSVIMHERQALDLFKVQDRGEAKAPVLITQSVWGSLERFIALLLEHYEGNLPAWLAPEQVRFLTITPKACSYAQEVAALVEKQGVRVKVDKRDVKLDEKVHTAQKEKVPYIVIIGENEVNKKNLTVKKNQQSDKRQKPSVTLDEFLVEVLNEVSCPILKSEINL